MQKNMKVSRKKTRRYLMQLLHARMYGDVNDTAFQDAFFDGIMDFQPDYEYLANMQHDFITHQKEVISVIASYAPKFDPESMLSTNILALGIAITEMLYLKEEIPAKVSINEAIELAKYFGDDSCKKIVNGILNSFYKALLDDEDYASKICPHEFSIFPQV